MKVNAYFLAADPAWIEASVRSYYARVDRIFVSYDERGIGWTGLPIDVEQCLRRLRAIDADGKMVYRPAHYARPEFVQKPMDGETFQRQCALDEASDGADWVVQLDSDEVVPDADLFFRLLAQADAGGFGAFDYPSRWLYSHLRGDWYLEWCARGGKLNGSFPGPMAVRAGSRFVVARRVTQERVFHADINATPGPGSYWQGGPSHAVVRPGDCVFHFSMVRSEAWLRRKFSTWSHSKDKDWGPEERRWLDAHARPIRTIVRSHFSRGTHKRPLRPMRVPPAVSRLIAASCVSDEATTASTANGAEAGRAA